MLRVEDVVDRGQADILVAAAVACHLVGVEQLVVVLEALAGLRIGGDGIAGRCARRRVPGRRGRSDGVAICGQEYRTRGVGDVVEEGMAGAIAPTVARSTEAAMGCRTARRRRRRRVEHAVDAGAGDDLREAGRGPGMNLP